MSRSRRALFAETIGATLEARASNKALSTDVKIAVDLPAMASGDVLRLRAALENLADNAVKFTDAGSVLFTADAETAPRKRVRLVYTFTDSGIGMSAGELKTAIPSIRARERGNCQTLWRGRTWYFFCQTSCESDGRRS